MEELGSNTASLLDRLAAGETVLVVRGGRAVAELRPVPDRPCGPRPFGLCAGAFRVPDDFDSPHLRVSAFLQGRRPDHTKAQAEGLGTVDSSAISPVRAP